MVFVVAAVSKEDSEDHNHGKLPYNGYSDEFLDRLEPNGNIPPGKGDIRYGKRELPPENSNNNVFPRLIFFKNSETGIT